MHLLIPCAGVLSPAGLQAQSSLALPHLAALLTGLTPTTHDAGDALSRIPPHERAWARALGLWQEAGEQSSWPQAAWLMQQDGLDPGTAAWGLLTPAHQHVGTEQVSLLDPEMLTLNEADSRRLFDALRELFESEGATLLWGAPQRWYLSFPALAGLATASLDRVIGRNVDTWLPDHAQARQIRRWLMEVQMLLHSHPLNDAREAAGQLSVNTCWLSGCGSLPTTPAAPASTPPPLVDDRLRRPALGEDWAAWLAAWQALDAGPLAEMQARFGAGEPVSLTLCGEHHAQRFDALAQPWWRRLMAGWRKPDLPAVLAAL